MILPWNPLFSIVPQPEPWLNVLMMFTLLGIGGGCFYSLLVMMMIMTAHAPLIL